MQNSSGAVKTIADNHAGDLLLLNSDSLALGPLSLWSLAFKSSQVTFPPNNPSPRCPDIPEPKSTPHPVVTILILESLCLPLVSCAYSVNGTRVKVLGTLTNVEF